MASFPQYSDADGNARGYSNAAQYNSFQEHLQASNRPSTPSRSPQRSWPRFSIPTNSDSLSSGSSYDTRLRQIGVSSEEWLRFTTEIVNEAKLSLEDDKAAWTAGIATGTAGSAMLLLLGPVAGYYTGKAVHKRTVVEKVKERLMENGQMSNVLRKWNDGSWKTRGFHTWIEFPNEGSGVDKKSPDTKRFRIVVIPQEGIPASPTPPQRPFSPPVYGSPSPPPPVVAESSFNQPPMQRPFSPPVYGTPTPPPPVMAEPSFNQPPIPHRNSTVVLPPPPLPLQSQPPVPQAQVVPGPQQYQNVQTPPPVQAAFRPPPPELPYRPYSPPQIPHSPPPGFIHQYQAVQSPVPAPVPVPVPMNFNYPPPPPPPPPAPAKVSGYNLPSTQTHEFPNHPTQTVFELPDTQMAPVIAELPSEPVYRYEMDGGYYPPVRR